MDIVDKIKGLELELSSLKGEHIKNKYDIAKSKYSHLVGRCYERNYQGEYFIVNKIDYNVNVKYMLDIQLVGILVTPYEYSPRIEEFRVSLINYEEDYEEIPFSMFNDKLYETFRHIEKIVNISKLQINDN